ncbi:MAG: hypothetical protein NTX86_02000 [Candidatus Dependentiae bacterium]|nr:hypothetical protein [Candidatus Dependentiae bacterium]
MKIIVIIFLLSQSGLIYCGACCSTLNSAIIAPEPDDSGLIPWLLKVHERIRLETLETKKTEDKQKFKPRVDSQKIIDDFIKEKEKKRKEEKMQQDFDVQQRQVAKILWAMKRSHKRSFSDGQQQWSQNQAAMNKIASKHRRHKSSVSSCSSTKE